MKLDEMNVTSPLLDLLSIGAENAKTAKELGSILNWNDTEIRHEVNRLRKSGVPICASPHGYKGYYMPSCRSEAAYYGKQFRARLADAQRACAVFSQFLDDGEQEQQNEKPPSANGGKG